MKWFESKVRNCQLHLFDSPYSKMILRSYWTFWKACNVLYNSYLKCISRILLELGEKLPWSWIQNLPKLGQNSLSYLVHEHVFINLYLEIQTSLGKSLWGKVLDLIEIYNFHVGSFLWIILHHGRNLAQSYEKNVNFQHLEKFLSLEILTFQNEILTFFDFLMNKFHSLTYLDELWSLILDFDQKVKVWLFSVQLTFHHLTEIHLSTNWSWGMFWSMPLCQNELFETLRS